MLKCRCKLKETGYKMYEDLSKEIHEMRKLQMEKLKNARKDGKYAYFSRSEPELEPTSTVNTSKCKM